MFLSRTTVIVCLMISAFFFFDRPTCAQDRTSPREPTARDLLDRIEILELEVQDLKAGDASSPWQGETSGDVWGLAGSSMGVSAGLMGNLGQTTRFSRTFNPSVGVVIDLVGNRQTGSDSGDHQDRFWLRAAELNLAAQIDPFGFAYLVVGGSDGENFSVAEAAAVMNRLPANFSIKAGKVLADFGKFGQHHVHALPFVEKPLVYYDYLGGSLNSTGVEVHQWFGLTDEIPLRWSLGVYNEIEGHGHRLWGGHEHGHDPDIEPFGKRQMNNFAYNGRVTAYGDLTDNASLQLGASCLWAPEIQAFHQEDDTKPVVRRETRRTLVGADLTYKWIDPASRREFLCGVEGLGSHGTFFHEEEEKIEDGDAYGGYAWCEYSFSPYWSAGLLAGAFESAQHDAVGQRELSSWVTWKISNFNWLRFQYRFNDLERQGEDFTGEDFSEFILQWVFVFGSHSHGLDW